MKKLFLFCTLTYTSFFIAQEAQIIKYPCSSIVDNYKINKGLTKWPKFKKGKHCVMFNSSIAKILIIKINDRYL